MKDSVRTCVAGGLLYYSKCSSSVHLGVSQQLSLTMNNVDLSGWERAPQLTVTPLPVMTVSSGWYQDVLVIGGPQGCGAVSAPSEAG